MKKLLLVLAVGVLAVGCGGDKNKNGKNAQQEGAKNTTENVKEIPKDVQQKLDEKREQLEAEGKIDQAMIDEANAILEKEAEKMDAAKEAGAIIAPEVDIPDSITFTDENGDVVELDQPEIDNEEVPAGDENLENQAENEADVTTETPEPEVEMETETEMESESGNIMDVDTSASSWVRGVTYNPETSVFTFNTDNQSYSYSDVPMDVFEAFKTAESFGTFINENIKGKFDLQ